MATTYSYSVVSDFGGSINIKQLHSEIVDDGGISSSIDGISRNDDNVDITFDSALSGGEQTTLANIILSFSADPAIWNIFEFETVDYNNSPIDISKDSILCNTIGGNITAKLPKADRNKDLFIGIRKIAAPNTVTILPKGDDLIGGQSSKILTANNETIIVQSDGLNWILGTGNESVSQTEIQAASQITSVKGDIIVDTGIMQTFLSVGTDNYAIIADSTTTQGIKWAQINHTNLSNIGSNTHAQIDTHISNSVAHGVSGSLVGTTDSQTLTNKTINTASNTLVIATSDITSGTFADARIASSNVTQHEGSINHDNLLGFVANEHLDWTADQGANNINQNNIIAASVIQHEGSITIGNLSGAPAGAVVGISDTQTLTNKTIDSTTNTVAADKLHSATTTIVVNGATAPTTGQVLTATSGTAANWQTPTAGGSTFDRKKVSATATTSTTSTIYIDLNSITITTGNLGGTGTYMINFHATCSNSSERNDIFYRLLVGGVAQVGTEVASSTARQANLEKQNSALTWMATGVASGTIIKIQWKSEGNTSYTYNRCLTIDGVLDTEVL